MKTSMRTDRRGGATGAFKAARLAGLSLGLALVLQSCQEEEERGTWFDTDLTQAAIAGDLDRVRYLVEAGDDIDEMDSDGGTPLMYAAAGSRPEHVEVVEFLINAGADVDARDGLSGWTALMVASSLGNAAGADVLVEAGADVDVQDDDGLTAFRTIPVAARTKVVLPTSFHSMLMDLYENTEPRRDRSDVDIEIVLAPAPPAVQARHAGMAGALAQAGADPDLGPRTDADALTASGSYKKWIRISIFDALNAATVRATVEGSAGTTLRLNFRLEERRGGAMVLHLKVGGDEDPDDAGDEAEPERSPRASVTA